jgi:phosphomannomutase/phosphoglucomutase
MSFLDAKIVPAVFREYDIRGIVGRDLNSDFAELLGLGYAKYLGKKQTVAVGRDCRLTSDEYADALIRGLRLGGLDVFSIGVCPTPVTSFSLFHYDLGGAIMITGSHNSRDYNGFKISVGRDTLHGEQIQEIRRQMEAALKEGAPTGQGDLTEKEIIPFYIDYLLKIARPLKKKKIVVDSGNGTAGSVAPELFKLLGADVVSLFGVLDGTFPNHHPDPTISSNLKHLVSEVKKEHADFGVAFDGDADRIVIVDENGRIFFGDELMVLLARDVLAENKGATIISDVKCSHRLYNDITARGGRAIMWKAGHSLIKSKMKEEKALLAGEMSAQYLHTRNSH